MMTPELTGAGRTEGHRQMARKPREMGDGGPQTTDNFGRTARLDLEVIGAADDLEPWTGDGVPEPRHAIRGLHSVTLGLLETQNTKESLELLSFRQTAEDGPSIRMEVGEGGSGRTIDSTHNQASRPGRGRTRTASTTSSRSRRTRRTASTSSRSASAAPAGC
jgi:hypothetical protein